MKSTKRIVSLLVVAVLLMSIFAGCGQKTASTVDETAAADQSTVIFTDSCDRKVEIPKNITKVAPSGAVAQMVLYTVAPDCLVGLANKIDDEQAKYYPADFADLPIFGQLYGSKSTINLESLISAKPQVIIDIGDKKENHGDDMDALQEQTGIPVIFIEGNIEDFPKAYRTLGELLSCEESGEKLAKYVETTMSFAEEISSKVPQDERKSVMFGTNATGLDCNASGSVQADVIDMIGADNAVVTDKISNKSGGTTIDMEQLYNIDPDVIILAEGGPFDKLKDDSEWSLLSAVKDDSYYEIPSKPFSFMSMPPSVNRVLGIYWLSKIVYPDYCKELDVEQKVQEYYSLFWHYELTDSETAELLENSIGKLA